MVVKRVHFTLSRKFFRQNLALSRNFFLLKYVLTRNTTSMSPVLSSIRQCFNCSNTVATIRESRRILTKMHDIFRQSFGNEALFFYASFPACRYIKICKNQKYYLTYLRNSEKSCNFAPATAFIALCSWLL